MDERIAQALGLLGAGRGEDARQLAQFLLSESPPDPAILQLAALAALQARDGKSAQAHAAKKLAASARLCGDAADWRASRAQQRRQRRRERLRASAQSAGWSKVRAKASRQPLSRVARLAGLIPGIKLRSSRHVSPKCSGPG